MTNATRILRAGEEGWPDGVTELTEDGIDIGLDRLFLRGKELPPKERMVAVVGTRRPTAAGIQATRDLTKGLVQAGFCIVSGLAMGIDAVAHRCALEAGGHTVAVLGCGVDLVYPKKNAALKGQIETLGTVLSEYPDATESASWRFPERNRIIAAISNGVLVVEGSFRSGALITARYGFDYGRRVLAIPGSIRNPMAAAPNMLIRTQAADLVTEVKHITDLLAPALVYSAGGEALARPVGLDEGEERVLWFLDDVAVSPDDVCGQTGMSIGEASIALSRLEVRGFVHRSAQGYEISDAGGRARSALIAHAG